jgi:hypothetical protein
MDIEQDLQYLEQEHQIRRLSYFIIERGTVNLKTLCVFINTY